MGRRPLALSDELTSRQAEFVVMYVRQGGNNGTQAAIAAGYSAKTGTAGAAVAASRLLRDPRILKAIKDECERCLRANTALATNVLIDLAQNADSEHVRLQAAEKILDRGGMQLASLVQHEHSIIDKRSDAELMARFNQIYPNLPVLDLNAKPASLPGVLNDITDAVLIDGDDDES